MRILIVSRQDICRGPMTAAALGLRLSLGSDNVVVESAGYDPRSRNSAPLIGAVEAVRTKFGRDISSYRSRYIGDVALNSYDRVLCIDIDAWDAVLANTVLSGVGVEILNPGNGGIPDIAAVPRRERSFVHCCEMVRSTVERLAQSAPYRTLHISH